MRLRQQSFSKYWIFAFLLKKVGFFETNYQIFWKRLNVKRRNFSLESEWDSVPFCTVFFPKKDGFLEKKLKLSKMAQISKLVVEWDGKSKSFQNVQKLCFFKKRWVFRENLCFFKSLKVANLLRKATEKLNFLRAFKIGFFLTKDGFFETKYRVFSKPIKVKVSKKAVDSVYIGTSYKCVFSPLCSVICQKKAKTLNVGSFRRNDDKISSFSSSKKASLPNWEGAKDAGGSRPSFYVYMPIV